jgi:hypothetical protein
MNKIHGEHTRQTSEPALCLSCDHATIVRGTRFGDDVIRCGPLGRVTFKVTACNAYRDAKLIPVYRLEESSWRWMPDLDRFVSPGEFMRLCSPSPTSAPGVPSSSVVTQAKSAS